jgi:argininosuccinate lyase
LKGLPLAYNRDLQEDKEALFDTVDTLLSTLDVLAEAVATLRFDAQRLRQAASGGYLLATDVADYLVKKGEPFREAHRIVGEIVQYALEQGKELRELTVADYRKFSPKFAEDVLRITPESSVTSRDLPGGTAPATVRKAVAAAKQRLKGQR